MWLSWWQCMPCYYLTTESPVLLWVSQASTGSEIKKNVPYFEHLKATQLYVLFVPETAGEDPRKTCYGKETLLLIFKGCEIYKDTDIQLLQFILMWIQPGSYVIAVYNKKWCEVSAGVAHLSWNGPGFHSLADKVCLESKQEEKVSILWCDAAMGRLISATPECLPFHYRNAAGYFDANWWWVSFSKK